MKRRAWIYFARRERDDAIVIGSQAEVRGLDVLAKMPGGAPERAALDVKFADERMRSGAFRSTPRLREYIDHVIAQNKSQSGFFVYMTTGERERFTQLTVAMAVERAKPTSLAAAVKALANDTELHRTVKGLFRSRREAPVSGRRAVPFYALIPAQDHARLRGFVAGAAEAAGRNVSAVEALMALTDAKLEWGFGKGSGQLRQG